jgi:hypothetical protein
MNPETKLPDEEPILDEQLNNISCDYCNFKNYSPYLKHQGAIYYYKMENYSEAHSSSEQDDKWYIYFNEGEST